MQTICVPSSDESLQARPIERRPRDTTFERGNRSMKLHHQMRVPSKEYESSSELTPLEDRSSFVGTDEARTDEERPPTDPQTLEEISSAVENGTYHPDLEDLAERLIESPELSDLTLYSS